MSPDYWATQAIAYQKKKEELSIAIQRVIEADKAANSAKDPILGSADTLNPDSRGGENDRGRRGNDRGRRCAISQKKRHHNEQQGSAGFTPKHDIFSYRSRCLGGYRNRSKNIQIQKIMAEFNPALVTASIFSRTKIGRKKPLN